MAESLPTSLSAFSSRRRRADSTTSFTYYQEDEEDAVEADAEALIIEDDGEDLGDVDVIPFEIDAHGGPEEQAEEEDSSEYERIAGENDYVLQRHVSTQSQVSVSAPLLRRDSVVTDRSVYGGAGRVSQKIYMVNEDLTIVIAGFRTSTLGLALYCVICLATLGLGWLLFRWLPRWQVRVLGRVCALRECEWVVLEVAYPRLSSLFCSLFLLS